MKVIFSKTWIFVLPIIVSLHLYKVMLFVFLLLSFHEAMHILCAKYFGYSTQKVVVYPFGLCAYISHLEHHNSYHEILIIIAGLSVHIFMYVVLQLLLQMHIISDAFLQYLNEMNLRILIMNLLPLYPLDGGRIIKAILEILFPYRFAKIVSLISSLFFLLLLLWIGWYQYQAGRCIALVFIILWAFYLFHFQKEVSEFYLFRYLYGPFGKVKMHAYNDLYKNKTNIIIRNKKLWNEKDFLSHYI